MSETTTEWVAGFSDYPVGDEETYDLTAELSSLPGETQQSSFLLTVATTTVVIYSCI